MTANFQNVAAERDWWPALLGGVVLAPVGYVGFVTFGLWLQGLPVRLHKPFPWQAFAVLLLALLGGLAVEGWYRGLRDPLLVAAVGTLLRPWLISSPFSFRPTYVVIVVLGAMLVGTFEIIGRYPTQVRKYATSATGKLALVIGLGHYVVGVGIQYYVGRFRRLYVTEFPSLVLAVAMYALFGLGLVALGALPVILWRRERLVLPAFGASGWLLWGVYGIWQTRHRFPLSAFAGTDFLAFRPYPDYLLQWAVALIGIVGLAIVEWGLRTLVTPDGNHPKETDASK